MNEGESKTYQRYTIIVEPEKQVEFERELEHIKSAYGTDTANEALKALIFDFRRLKWIAEHYNKIRESIKELEASEI